MLNTKQDSRYPWARLGNVRLEKACMVTEDWKYSLSECRLWVHES